MIELAPLPRGRHKLSAETVRASQRERILLAIEQCVGEQGYAATTVPQVTARARVSRSTFYTHFSDKASCFTTLVDERSDVLLTMLVASADGQDDWLDALRNGVDCYLRWWEERPAYCRAFFVELPAAGEAAFVARDRAFERFGAMFTALADWARHADPGLPPLEEHDVAFLVYAITELIGQEWRAGRAGRLRPLRAAIVRHAVRILAYDGTGVKA